MRQSLLLIAVLIAPACHRNEPKVAPTAAPAALVLNLDDLFEKGAHSLVPTQALKNANGRQVRLMGHMAQMELPPTDGFYLVRRPVHCDEAGGGTADLPPDAVRVVVGGGALPFAPGPIEVEGRVELGRKEHSDGTVSQIRLIMGAEAAPSAKAAEHATAS